MRVRGNGFTLIELMVTIAVLAIIAMMAAPSFNQLLDNYNYKMSYERVVADLKEARSKAAAERAIVTVCIALINEDDCLTKVGVSNARKMAFKDSGRVVNVQLKNEVKVVGDSSFIFSPNGSSQTSLIDSSALSKKMIICYNKKSREILVSKLGGVSIGAEGIC